MFINKNRAFLISSHNNWEVLITAPNCSPLTNQSVPGKCSADLAPCFGIGPHFIFVWRSRGAPSGKDPISQETTGSATRNFGGLQSSIKMPLGGGGGQSEKSSKPRVFQKQVVVKTSEFIEQDFSPDGKKKMYPTDYTKRRYLM